MPPPTGKRPSSNKKKQRQKQRGQSKPATPPSLEEVLAKADQALEASDVETALGLFTYASDVLRKRLDGTTDGSGDASSMAEDEVKTLLSRVLGKAGEARVSLADPDGGRECFEEAIELLQSTVTTDDKMAGSDIDHASSMADAQLCEARAGLHLYLGQLSSEKDALSSYQNGVQELEQCVKILDRLSNAEEAVTRENPIHNALVETR